MSDPRLVFDPDHAQAARTQFFDQIIFFVIKRRAAELRERECVIHGGAVRQRAHEGFIARALYETGDPIHRPIEWTLFPAIGVGSAVFHFGQTID